jgi:tRNA-binding protein
MSLSPRFARESSSGLAAGVQIVSYFWTMIAQSEFLSYAEFERVDIRVGRVIEVQDFPEARKPAYKLKIDFGVNIGIKKSSAQATKHYSKDDLLDRLVLAVVNFPPKQIGPFMSEVLTLGVPDGEGAVVLLTPERGVPLGGRMF